MTLGPGKNVVVDLDPVRLEHAVQAAGRVAARYRVPDNSYCGLRCHGIMILMTDRRAAPEWSPWAALVGAPRPSGRAQAFVAVWGLLVVVYVAVPAVSTIALPDGLTLTAIGVLGAGFAELLDPALRPFAIGLRCVGLATALVGGFLQLL